MKNTKWKLKKCSARLSDSLKKGGPKEASPKGSQYNIKYVKFKRRRNKVWLI